MLTGMIKLRGSLPVSMCIILPPRGCSVIAAIGCGGRRPCCPGCGTCIPTLMFYCLYFFIHALIEAPRLKGFQSCCSCVTRTVRYDARITHTRVYPPLSSCSLSFSYPSPVSVTLAHPTSELRGAPALPHTPRSRSSPLLFQGRCRELWSSEGQE